MRSRLPDAWRRCEAMRFCPFRCSIWPPPSMGCGCVECAADASTGRRPCLERGRPRCTCVTRLRSTFSTRTFHGESPLEDAQDLHALFPGKSADSRASEPEVQYKRARACQRLRRCDERLGMCGIPGVLYASPDLEVRDERDRTEVLWGAMNLALWSACAWMRHAPAHYRGGQRAERPLEVSA